MHLLHTETIVGSNPSDSTKIMIKTTYAVQTYDGGNNQKITRFATSDRSELTRKCVSSFLVSVQQCVETVPTSIHEVHIVDDGSSEETRKWLLGVANKFKSANISITIHQHSGLGVMGCIRKCYEILRDSDGDLVYQVQDDYLFEPSAITECIDIFMQVSRDVDTHPVISPYNDPNSWQTTYRYATTPRTIVPGAKGYWIQMYDTSCSFLTSKVQFNKHWDLYEAFLAHAMDHRLEADTLNKMFVERGVLGLMRFNSIALHMQSDLEKDPYINWKERWDNVPVL
jgi:hypothetical protein